MDTFFNRYKNSLVLALALVAQFCLLAVQVRRPFPAAAAKVDQAGVHALRFGVATVVTPPESLLHKSGLSVRGVWQGYLDLIGVREENAQLKAEVDRLRMEQAELAEDARQGERLQDLLAFRQNYVQSTVPAQVVGGGGADHGRILYLDKGSDDGLAPEMPVITPDGIVGRLREVYPHTAQVLEISDPSSAAGVLLEDTRTRGILRGNLHGQPQIVNLMPDERIKPGQLVLTSGGDQIFPRGLPVGRVDHIAPDHDNDPMVDVVLKPAANLSRLEEVLVVTATGPAPTERTRKDLAKSGLIAAGARAAKEAAADQTANDTLRASEVLAERLPSRYDQANFYAPDATADASPATSEAQVKALHPPNALHADHYSPSGVPSAGSLTPGQRYSPLVQGGGATEQQAAKPNENVNATDRAPVNANPAFAAAAAAVAAQHKAAEQAKAADAARKYAALHPGEAPTAGAKETNGGEANAVAATPTVRYVDRVNADGTTTRVAVPAAPAVHYVDRVNADGTTTRVAVPNAPAVRYVDRVNADGTTTRVAVPAAPAVHYVDRVNADGTTTRVAVPNAPAVRYVDRVNADGTTTRVAVPAAPAVHYVDRVNADGTTTRVAVPAAPAPGAGATQVASGSAPAVRYTTRTNPDGTTTRVAVPAAPAGSPSSSGVRYVTRTNPDGTTTRVAVPATRAPATPTPAPHYTLRTNPDGTTTRVLLPTAPGTASGPAVRYVTRTNADGTTTRVAVPIASTALGSSAKPPSAASLKPSPAPGTASTVAPTTAAGPTAAAKTGTVQTHVVTDGPIPTRTAPRTSGAGSQSGATTPSSPAVKRKSPDPVPDDGSRPPPARKPATQPSTSQPAPPQGNP